MKRRSERAVTLIETLIVVGILVVLLGGLAAFSLGRRAYALRAAVATVHALVDETRAAAATSGNGATLAFTPASGGGFTASIYPFRPLPGANLSVAPLRSTSGAVGIAAAGIATLPFAIFISSFGTSSAAAWTPNQGTLAAEPACNGTITLLFDDGSRVEPHALDCGAASLR